MTPDERARELVSAIDQCLMQKHHDEADLLAKRHIQAAMKDERDACIALINEAREEGESDLRQVRNWISARNP